MVTRVRLAQMGGIPRGAGRDLGPSPDSRWGHWGSTGACSGLGQGRWGNSPVLRTSVQPSLPSACHSPSADGAKHLGVSIPLCPGRAEGASLPLVPSDCP